METSNDSPAGMPAPSATEKFGDVIVVIPAYNEELVIGRDIRMQLPGTLRNVHPIVWMARTIGYHVGS